MSGGRVRRRVIVDCSTPDRTGSLGSRVAGLPCLVIDHHSAGEAFGDARFVDPSAPSTSVLIQQLFEDAGVPYDADTARLMLFGLCTDTGFFRHLGPNSAPIFHAIARLVEHGTSTSDIYMMVYGRRELSARKLLAEMLTRTESHRGDRLLLTWQTVADRERLSAYQRGEDDLYRLLQTIKGNVVVGADQGGGGRDVLRGPAIHGCRRRRAPLPPRSAAAGIGRLPASTSREPLPT